MRNEGIPKFLFSAVIGLAVLMLLNIIGLHIVRKQYVVGASTGASLFNIIGQTKEWISHIGHWKDLSIENDRLNVVVSEQVSKGAIIESLQRENNSLRKTVGLATRLKHNLLPAGVFHISLGADGYYALINKGTTSGVTVGQTVASLNGELLGKIAVVFPESARVILSIDPAFSVTGRVLNSETSGIARGLLSDGMDFGLVTQSDAILEGDIIVTTGDDSIPAGLIVGSVRQVDNNDTQLFKKIKINPATQITQGSVVVIQP